MTASVKEISTMALGLPLRSRALLADMLLDSLDETVAGANETAWLEVARRRDQEIADGRVRCRTHDQVMTAARKSLRCVKT